MLAKIFSFITTHTLWSSFFAGLLMPLGFAPFHKPGLAIIGIALFFTLLESKKISKQNSLLNVPQKNNHNSSILSGSDVIIKNTTFVKKIFLHGLVFGFSYFALGISWVYISIHEYGNLNIFISALITLCFIIYLALYPAMNAVLYIYSINYIKNDSIIYKCLLFSSYWCLTEYLRSILFGGFPWLILGVGQIDTPLKHLLPIGGVYSLSFLSAFSAACLYFGFKNSKRWFIVCILILIMPGMFSQKEWTKQIETPISTSVIQANLSMRDKWDEDLFLQLLKKYSDEINHLITHSSLIILPESAIVLPRHYLEEFIQQLNNQANQNNSAILLGMPEPAKGGLYYNSMVSLGNAKGNYFKQKLVPFGEYIPSNFQKLIDWLEIPIANMTKGASQQPLIKVHDNMIASLICYEIAYPELLRAQLPDAHFIVSISDNGWFGHSFAAYQQLQMATALSIASGRFQVLANNDGLSSIINKNGAIINLLPAHTSGVLEGNIFANIGKTPWVNFGDKPILLFCLLFILFTTIIANLQQLNKFIKRNKPMVPNNP